MIELEVGNFINHLEKAVHLEKIFEPNMVENLLLVVRVDYLFKKLVKPDKNQVVDEIDD